VTSTRTSNPRHVVARAATLLATSAVGRMPQAMSALAIVQLVLADGGSYSLAATLTSVFVIASTVGAPVLGRVVDRTGRPKPVLLGSSIASAVSLLWLAGAVANPAAAVAAVVVAGFTSPPLEPTLRGFWPRLFPEPERLHRAYSADAAAQELLFITGPLLTVLAVATFGGPGAVRVMAVLVVAGTAAFCLHRMPSMPSTPQVRAGRTRSPLRIKALRVLVVAQIGAGLPIGVLTITAAAHAERVGTTAASGWGLAVNATGALVGVLLVARFPLRIAPERAVRILLSLLALLYLPTAMVAWPTPAWLATAFVAGLCLPPLLTQVFALAGTIAPAEVATEANAWGVSAFSVGIAFGTLLAGMAADAWGTEGVAAPVVLASVVTALAAVQAGSNRLAPAP